jgi:hypothetical protein
MMHATGWLLQYHYQNLEQRASQTATDTSLRPGLTWRFACAEWPFSACAEWPFSAASSHQQQGPHHWGQNLHLPVLRDDKGLGLGFRVLGYDKLFTCLPKECSIDWVKTGWYTWIVPGQQKVNDVYYLQKNNFLKKLEVDPVASDPPNGDSSATLWQCKNCGKCAWKYLLLKQEQQSLTYHQFLLAAAPTQIYWQQSRSLMELC